MLNTTVHNLYSHVNKNPVNARMADLQPGMSETGRNNVVQKGWMCVVPTVYQTTAGLETTLCWQGEGRGTFL